MYIQYPLKWHIHKNASKDTSLPNKATVKTYSPARIVTAKGENANYEQYHFT
jgi:hypothetical protein